MPNCIVAGCTSKKNKHNTMEGVILHVFPRNLLRIKMWLQQTGQDFGDLDEFAQKVLDGKKTDVYRLCSVHFTPQCYMDCATKKALRVDAVPTIFHIRDANSLRKARMATIRTSEASTQTDSRPDTQTTKSLQWEELGHVETDPHRIDEIMRNFTKRLLDLTMEIIHLLTGEDYAVVKKTSGEHVTPDPHMSGGCSRTQSPIMETPPPSLIPEQNYKKILEVTNKITELLTGEVPIRCQDATSCFSMEESEDLEGHKDKDVMMENPHNQGESSVFIKDEATEEHEELYVKGDETCMGMEVPPDSTDPEDTKTTQRDIKIKEEEEGHVWVKEEEIPVQISTDSEDTRDTQRFIKIEEEEEGYARIKEEEIPPEISTDPEDIGDTQRDIKVEVEEEGHVRIKEEETPPEISTGENYDNMETNPISHYDSGTDDDITDNSSDEYPVDPKSNPAPHSAHLSPDPPTHETGCSDHSYPNPHGDGEEVLSSENGGHPRTCRLCEKSFSEQSILRQHEKTHKGEMPYYCLECGKDYLHKSRFISHRRIHTGEKPYLCSKCGKSFANKPDLVRHVRTHTGEKPFSCPDCGKHFTQRVHLVNHKKKHGLQTL